MIRKTASPAIRRVLALLALGWFTVLLQPCFAAAPAMPADMEHCAHEGTDHSGTADVPCLEMQAEQCVAATDLNADAPRATGSAPVGALLLLLPAAPAIRAASRVEPIASAAAGPPLNIRYCVLRN